MAIVQNMKAPLFTSDADAQAFLNTVNIALGIPSTGGTRHGDGIFPPLNTVSSTTYSNVIKHPTLDQWLMLVADGFVPENYDPNVHLIDVQDSWIEDYINAQGGHP